MSNQQTSEKLDKLAKAYDYPNADGLLNRYSSTDPSVPGICTSPKCDHVQDVPPKRQNDYCEECEEQSVTSGLVLAGYVEADPND